MSWWEWTLTLLAVYHGCAVTFLLFTMRIGGKPTVLDYAIVLALGGIVLPLAWLQRLWEGKTWRNRL